MVVPDRVLILRTGRPNRFRSEDKIKNVFRGGSSLVARTFLLKPEYESVQEAERFIRTRGGTVTLPTVSKVSKSLESLLVIERTRGEGGAAPAQAPPARQTPRPPRSQLCAADGDEDDTREDEDRR